MVNFEKRSTTQDHTDSQKELRKDQSSTSFPRKFMDREKMSKTNMTMAKSGNVTMRLSKNALKNNHK